VKDMVMKTTGTEEEIEKGKEIGIEIEVILMIEEVMTKIEVETEVILVVSIQGVRNMALYLNFFSTI
jgi:hypothetical protein